MKKMKEDMIMDEGLKDTRKEDGSMKKGAYGAKKACMDEIMNESEMMDDEQKEKVRKVREELDDGEYDDEESEMTDDEMRAACDYKKEAYGGRIEDMMREMSEMDMEDMHERCDMAMDEMAMEM